MNFNEKVQDLISNFYRKNLYMPNELFLGLEEKFEFQVYIQDIPSRRIDEITKKAKIEFNGLKVRFSNKTSDFRVDYNPHYENS